MIDKIKPYVMEVLEENKEARDDDFLLTMSVYVKMGFARKLPLGVMIEYKNLEFAPAFETITRIRREIQHDMGLFKPSQEAQVKRHTQKAVIEERYTSAHSTKYAKAENQENSWMSP